ncbi:ABC transporter ATP-binding protein [Microbacterium sp. NPDC087665]|uniref:ABC transporter ATP-binding protein n=1 Tax=Microbacterium sp. NPDC087665 TaxID=3364194 RepID=UPI0037F8626C
MTPAIELTRLRKQYGRRTAVDSLDLRIEPGSVFGLIGPNGAGKTTTLRMILDIIRPTAGAIRVLGEDPRRGGPALRRRIGFIPGELRLDGRMTGRRLLDFYSEVSSPVTSGTIDRLADRLDLDLSRPVHALSKGNKQKLGIVQAFMHEPPLLVLDEPTSGLDPLVQREFLRLVTDARDRGQTVLLSSHVLSEIQQTADVVAVLSQGKIVAEGDVASLRLGAIRRVRVGLAATNATVIREQLGALPHISELDVRSETDIVRVSATVDGDIDPLVKWLAQCRVIDLAVEEPDLEESVLRLYGEPSRPETGERDA